MSAERVQTRDVLIFVDNLNMGGYQRLALDQSYCLRSEGHRASLISMSELPAAGMPSFIALEADLINDIGLKIEIARGGRVSQFRYIRNLLRFQSTETLVISHSLRATVILAIIKTTISCKYKIHTTIHQIPGLSHLAQRKRRFFYGQFSDFLYGYSNAVVIDWRKREETESILYKLGISKKIELLRNGVYIPRIPQFLVNELKSARPRLIYIGRSTHWKGLSEFLKFGQVSRLNKFDFLILMPQFDRTLISDFEEDLLARFHVLEGRTITDIERVPGDVHIYPTQYGQGVNIIEGISLNCIEMACMGIPSVISENGLSTWPEKVLEEIFTETDWLNHNLTVSNILAASERSINIKESTVIAIRDLFSISTQISSYINGKL